MTLTSMAIVSPLALLGEIILFHRVGTSVALDTFNMVIEGITLGEPMYFQHDKYSTQVYVPSSTTVQLMFDLLA